MPADLPPPGTRWGDLTDEQRARLPEGTVLGVPPRQPWWGVLVRRDGGWRDANGNIVSVPASRRPILSYPAPPAARPSTVTIRLTPALYARAIKAGMPKGERALAEWLVSRAEVAATARADALEEAAQTCEGLGSDFAYLFPEQDRRTVSVVRAACDDAALNIRNLTAKKEAP